MSIIRVEKRKNPYVVIDKTVFEDDRLSFKAKGLAAYLLSKPDNWQVNERHLASIGTDGRSSVSSGLKELEAAGYLKREKLRNADGTYTWDSVLYETPYTEKPWLENPTMDNPALDNQAIISKEVKSKEGKKPPPGNPVTTLDPSLETSGETKGNQPPRDGKQAKLTGDPYLDAAANKYNRQQNGQAVYGREAKALAWNRELPVSERLPIAEAIAVITGKLPLWNAEDERVHDDLHTAAIAAHRMGYNPHSIIALLDQWRADWRGKNGGSVSQCLDFLSEQVSQPAKQAKRKKYVATPEKDLR